MKLWAQKKTPPKPLIFQNNPNLQFFYQHIVEVKQNIYLLLHNYINTYYVIITYKYLYY